ncbi:hypothetical protein EIP91_010463 [Steccherinum ochraceum]|uniref:UDP-glycosyltransferases domain-containing protein n=1 Tax=Steccherinum ochraceum TaxID=92696 RepID=A0A4R0RWX6_9APHY|nr:hypothetical protein EIP91_010463 [Steccherinum ochraceum]
MSETMKLEQMRYMDTFMILYANLLHEKPVTCFTTNTEYPAIPSPKMVILDFIVGPLTSMLKTLPGNKAKTIGFCSGMASFCFTFFAPVEQGGRADFREKAAHEAQQTGRDINKVAEDMLHRYTDEIIQMPGLPKMYHWELGPQEANVLTTGFGGILWLILIDTYEACDGVIITSPEAYEPEAIAATHTKEAREGEEAQSQASANVRTFMDMVVDTFGKGKMLYISFGSMFWPPAPQIELFVDVLIEKKIPFILSHGSPFAQLSDAFQAKVKQSGIGLLSKWSAQQTILVHPALGWFVSHCGHNSTLEAVASGVPIIAWPLHADQPANAVNLTDVHDVAYELLEVRTGSGLKPIFRTGKAPAGTLDALRSEIREVLDRAFGEDGARKKAGAKALQAKVLSAWDEGGPAAVDMTKLLDMLA